LYWHRTALISSLAVFLALPMAGQGSEASAGSAKCLRELYQETDLDRHELVIDSRAVSTECQMEWQILVTQEKAGQDYHVEVRTIPASVTEYRASCEPNVEACGCLPINSITNRVQEDSKLGRLINGLRTKRYNLYFEPILFLHGTRHDLRISTVFNEVRIQYGESLTDAPEKGSIAAWVGELMATTSLSCHVPTDWRSGDDRCHPAGL